MRPVTDRRLSKRDYLGVGLFISGAVIALAALYLGPANKLIFVLQLSTTALAQTLLTASLFGFALFLLSESKKSRQPEPKQRNREQEAREGTWVFAVTLTIALGVATAVYYLIPGLGGKLLGFS